MAAIRIFIPTFRRPQLLRRALQSLVGQTRADWIGEIHNDDPDDEEPSRILAAIGDSRLSLITHRENLGPTRTFNAFFEPVEETYISILEDDNWWEPAFLKTLSRALDERPDLCCAWSNMRIHEEQADGSWLDTGTTTWPVGEGLTVFNEPQPQQWNQALHSHGAMMVRSNKAGFFIVPDETPIAVIEMVRERRMPRPYAVLHRPLANFARTLKTSRGNAAEWSAMQFLLVTSYLRDCPSDGIGPLWKEARTPRPPASNILLLAALAENRRDVWKYAKPAEWAAFFRGIIGHPVRMFATLSAGKRYPQLWRFLKSHTVT